jgi:cell division protein FtsI/penicillin-binding protein 2
MYMSGKKGDGHKTAIALIKQVAKEGLEVAAKTCTAEPFQESRRLMTLDEATEQVMEVVDQVTDPEYMTKKEYQEFLGSLIGDLRIRKEAVDQELEEEPDGRSGG